MRITKLKATSIAAVSAAAIVVAPAAQSQAATHHHHYYCAGHRATIVGNNHRNVIHGTKHADVIVGRGGKDIIFGGGGNDIICAGRGADVINGQSGSDYVNGGPGKDFCLAPTAKEHRRHHHCEVHLPSGGHSHASVVVAARAAGIKLARSMQRRQEPAASTFPNEATCSSLGGGLYVYNVEATSAWMGPARVEVVPVHYTFTSSGWSAMHPDGGQEWTAFAYDGIYYRYPADRAAVPKGGVYYLGYFFYWQNPNTGQYDRWAFAWQNEYHIPYGNGFGASNVGFCYPAYF